MVCVCVRVCRVCVCVCVCVCGVFVKLCDLGSSIMRWSRPDLGYSATHKRNT